MTLKDQHASAIDPPGETVSRPNRSLQIPFLDVLRGAAALVVVLHHGASITSASMPQVMDTFPYSVTHYGVFGVEIFFVVSGYCIAAAAVNNQELGKGIWDFAVARWRRIYLPYWASFFLISLMALIVTYLVQKGIIGSSNMAEGASLPPDPLSIASNLTLTQLVFGNRFFSPVSWTLCYEVAFYVFFGVGLVLARRTTSTLLRLMNGLTVLVLVWQVLFPGRLSYPLDMWAMFGIGIVAYQIVRAERNDPKGKKEALITAVTLSALTLVAMLRGANTHVSIMMHSTILGFAVALATGGLIILVRNVSQKTIQTTAWRPLAEVGIFSYSLYLIHFSCLGIANQTLKLLKISPTSPLLRLALFIIVTLIGGYLFYLFFEKPLSKKQKTNLKEHKVGKPTSLDVRSATNI